MKKVNPQLPKQPLDPSSVRQSSRVADLPPKSYKEVSVLEGMGKPRSYQRRDLLNRVYAGDEERQYAVKRAEDLHSSLDQDVPSFIKPMLQSHVTGGFWWEATATAKRFIVRRRMPRREHETPPKEELEAVEKVAAQPRNQESPRWRRQKEKSSLLVTDRASPPCGRQEKKSAEESSFDFDASNYVHSTTDFAFGAVSMARQSDPQHFRVTLRTDEERQRWNKLVRLNVQPSRYPDWQTVQDLGIRDNFEELCTMWKLSALFDKPQDSYRAITLEFLSTLNVRMKGKEVDSISFRLQNRPLSLSIADFNNVFSFYGEGVGITEEPGSLALSFDVDLNGYVADPGPKNIIYGVLKQTKFINVDTRNQGYIILWRLIKGKKIILDFSWT
ncbi:hypothetical protein SASPL_151804 [Salvia splendens]|uniref:Arabidopsis retrotransposon Orf1 C-terminal domain-containing protein n=1 Tax=Salvia splendens TaxID=180675 RepID=A0A8X8YZQ7_SALSN|nr:hypothetical protein SASPL_151804 [Salvia splendens]